MVPNGENSLRRRSSSKPSSRFFTYRLTPCYMENDNDMLCKKNKKHMKIKSNHHNLSICHIKATTVKLRVKITALWYDCWNNLFQQNRRHPNLVSGHSILFHLLKFTLELILALPFLLCTTHIDLPAIHFFTVHVIHCLQWLKKQSKRQTKAVFNYLDKYDRLCPLEERNKDVIQTFCASSCLSKLTNPNPLDLPLSSVMTRILSAGPRK